MKYNVYLLLRGGYRISEMGGGGGLRVIVNYSNTAPLCICAQRFIPSL